MQVIYLGVIKDFWELQGVLFLIGVFEKGLRSGKAQRSILANLVWKPLVHEIAVRKLFFAYHWTY